MSKIPIYSAKEQTSRRHAGAIAFTAAFLSRSVPEEAPRQGVPPRHHWGFFHIYAGRGTSKLTDDVGHRWEETRYRIVELVAGRAS